MLLIGSRKAIKSNREVGILRCYNVSVDVMYRADFSWCRWGNWR